MKLTKKVELGIKAVTVLKTRSEPVRVEDLAKEIGTTMNFLEQIMRNLRRAGIAESIRGPGGGFVLSKTPTPFTAYHVATALGRDFGTLKLDDAPMSRLGKALTEAYLNTAI